MKPLTSHLVLAADATIDLQMHTTSSDGTWTPEQLIDYLVSEQFGLVSITDHDRVDTAPSLQQLAAHKRLPVLAAVEMSTSWNGALTDVLCYGFDPEHNELQDLAQDIARRQQENTSEVYENLRKMGYLFLHPHELVALLEKPSARQPHELVALLKQQGYGTIDGFEVYYPAHTPEQIVMYREYAKIHCLLISSGSDSHGPEKKPIKYQAELSRNLLERLGIQIK